MNRNNFFVSVVIPVFNEERTIGDIITRTRNTLEKFKIPYEVLVIDDGSVDRSPDISKAKEANVYRVTHQDAQHVAEASAHRCLPLLPSPDSRGRAGPEARRLDQPRW